MAHRTLGCPHHTSPLRAVPVPRRRLPVRQPLTTAPLHSPCQSGCSEQTISSQKLSRRKPWSCAQPTAHTKEHWQLSLACCAQSQSGTHDSSFDASSQQAQADTHAQVPWGMKEFVSVTLLWFFAFWFLGYFVLPGTLNLFGLDKDELSITNQALYHVVFDLCQLGLTVRVLFQQLKAFRPRRRGWFNARLRPVKSWLVPVIFAAMSFPILDWAAKIAQAWFPDDLWTQTIEQSIMRGDPTCNLVYFASLIFCAPIWEEAMFRGFMLPTLSKYMPRPISLLLTSAVFAILHFSVQRFIPLVLLGLILGFIYMRTRNLVAPIALHSVWNMYIFYNLLRRGSGILG